MSADTRSNPKAGEPASVAEDNPQAGDAGSNRRAFPRLKPGEVSGLETARLASGAEIKLIDLSRGGAQFESDRRFLPNATVSLRLVTNDSTFVVNGRVVRSRIVRLASGGLGYNVAVAFNELLQHVIEDAPRGRGEVTPDAGPDAAPAAGENADPAVTPSVREAETLSTAPAPSEIGTGVTAEEGAAFDAAAVHAPAMLTVTAAVDSSGEELLDMFNGNDW